MFVAPVSKYPTTTGRLLRVTRPASAFVLPRVLVVAGSAPLVMLLVFRKHASELMLTHAVCQRANDVLAACLRAVSRAQTCLESIKRLDLRRLELDGSLRHPTGSVASFLNTERVLLRGGTTLPG